MHIARKASPTITLERDFLYLYYYYYYYICVCVCVCACVPFAYRIVWTK